MKNYSPLSLAALPLVAASVANAQTALYETYGLLRGERFGKQVFAHADIDGDGIPEYAVAHARGVRILRGSDGVLVRDIPRAEYPIGDLDGDGEPDYYAAVRTDLNAVEQIDVLSGATGALILSMPWEWDLQGPSGVKWYYPLAFDDIDGDGFDDFFVQVTRFAIAGNTTELLIRSGRDQSTLRVYTDRANVVPLNDIDGDGVRDFYLARGLFPFVPALVVSGASGITLATPSTSAAVPWDYALSIGDVDADGANDLALLDGYGAFGAYTTTIASTMTGAVIATFPGKAVGGDLREAAHGDFDGDGAEDIVVTDLSTHELVLRTCSTGAVIRTDRVVAVSALGLPDLNGDGRDELLIGAPEARSDTGKALVLAGPYSELVGAPFGFGDGTSGTCPCSNGAVGRGCANSQGDGAKLEALGKTSIVERDLRFYLEGHWVDFALEGRSFLIASANPAATPLAFRGGLLALAAPIQRLARTSASWFDAPSLAAWSSWTPGQTAHFQVWYRDGHPAGACGFTGNLSNALALTFTP